MGNKSYSKGISWFDDCRIPFVDGDGLIEHQQKYKEYKKKDGDSLFGFEERIGNKIGGSSQGRFPANILVSDDMLNDGVISKSISGGISSGVNFGGETTKYRNRTGHDDKGTNSRYYDIDKWFNNLIDV